MARKAPKIASIAAGTPNMRYSEYIDNRDKRREANKNRMPIISILLLENSLAMLLIIDILHYSIR
jgi:hypothetical protein